MAIRFVLAGASLGILLALMPPAATAASLQRFSEFINETLTARGEFEQKIFDRNRKLLQESRGTLAFSRPGKFRWSYVKPYAPTDRRALTSQPRWCFHAREEAEAWAETHHKAIVKCQWCPS